MILSYEMVSATEDQLHVCVLQLSLYFKCKADGAHHRSSLPIFLPTFLTSQLPNFLTS